MEMMVGVVAVIFLVIAFFVYLAGQLSGLIFKGSWPEASFSNFPGIAARGFSNPGDPAAAWPEQAAGQVPGVIAYYLTFIVLLVVAVFAAKFGRDLWQGTRRKDANNAQWARGRDIKTLVVPHAGIRGRLVLGKSNGKLIATEPRQSVIVMGPTQTGKTTGFAVPAILEWDGPVIAASVKNDLVKDTYKWRRSQGEVWLFDPTRSTGFDYEDVRAGWSPLSQAIDWGGARKVSSWLCKANKSAGGGLSDGDFWFSAAEKMMSPYLFAAAVGGKDMATVLRWIDVNEEREVKAILDRAGVIEAQTAFEANMKRDERTKSSIFTTAETIVDAYNDPLVCESAANPTIFSSELLNGGNNTLYICAPSHEQDRLQAIFTAIVSQMKSAAYELAGKQNRPVDPPLLICIDEAANIAPLSDLDALASTAAGIGIQLVTIFQDMAQIEARYKERARTVVNNHRAKVILSGISDTGTLEYVSKLCGEEEIDQQSTSISAQGEKSTTDSKQQRTLASGAYLRRMKFGEGIVVYGQLSPAKLVLRQWFKDRVLKHMVEFGTKPGVAGGPTGANSFVGGSTITKDAASIPAMSAVTSDAQYMAQDMLGNQAFAPRVPGSGPLSAPVQGTEELSAFDKALAELRARDAQTAGMPAPAASPGSPPIAAPLTDSFSPPPAASPAKWKPSGGGVVEDNDDSSGFGSAAVPAPPIDSLPVPSTGSVADPGSKWSKGSHPAFVETPPVIETPPVVDSAPQATFAPTPAVVPTPPPLATHVPSVPTPAPDHVSPPFSAPVVPVAAAAAPTVPESVVDPTPSVSDVFAQYSAPVSDESEESESEKQDSPGVSEPSSEVTPPASPGSKPKWK